ncbi:hypothetical protein [Blastopirellula retiformator]|uniref:Uncharacterized protein n=1 Tax=Blastopirellula retiformator TaxID=2527970 RepID=A0A5C5V252_9BACT|nr:hypothetical protein [Blastopirellula retiformator]TWT32656.1 hypothetical protein Enr8_24610 [Blastopirellula retiformator]
MSESLKIILMCIAAAVVYGICQDMITTRICLEYFTVFHAPVWGGTTDPNLLALTWGVKATWWVGLILSIPAVLIARVGAPPRLTASDAIRPIGYLLLVMAIGSLVAGLTGWFLASAGVVRPGPDFAAAMPAEAHIGFLVDLWAHLAAYFFGFFGGSVVLISLWRKRLALRNPDAVSPGSLRASLWEGLKIVGLCIAAAVLFGICHDLITTRICVEYFTILHPPIWGGATDPTVLALSWGVIATWWVGLILSFPAVILARFGAPPKLTAGDLVRPIGYLLLTMAIGSLVAGLVGWQLASFGAVFLTPRLAEKVPPEAHVGAIIDMWAHSAAYAFGSFGGIGVCIWIWMRRRFLRGRAAVAARAEQGSDAEQPA